MLEVIGNVSKRLRFTSVIDYGCFTTEVLIMLGERLASGAGWCAGGITARTLMSEQGIPDFADYAEAILHQVYLAEYAAICELLSLRASQGDAVAIRHFKVKGLSYD